MDEEDDHSQKRPRSEPLTITHTYSDVDDPTSNVNEQERAPKRPRVDSSSADAVLAKVNARIKNKGSSQQYLSFDYPLSFSFSFPSPFVWENQTFLEHCSVIPPSKSFVVILEKSAIFLEDETKATV